VKKTLILLIAAIAVAAAIVIPVINAGQYVDVVTQGVAHRDIIVNLELTGEVQLSNIYTVTSATGGIVAEVPVKEGDIVSFNSPLLTLDTSTYEQELAALKEQEKNLKSSITASTSSGDLLGQMQLEGALTLAQAASFDLNGFNEIITGGDSETAANISTDQTLAAADPELQAALAEVQTKKNALSAEINNAVYTSTIAGTVLSVNIKQGELLAPGVPAVTVGDTSSGEVVALVTEGDLAKLEEGMPCTFHIQEDSTSYTGVISSLGAVLSGLSDSDATVKQAKVFIRPDAPFSFIPGSTVEISIELGRAEDVLSIPIEAMAEDESVFVVDDQGVLKRKYIKTGLFDSNYIEVLSGLKTGENVALIMEADLEDGMRVAQ